jgi:hypothetical protein
VNFKIKDFLLIETMIELELKVFMSKPPRLENEVITGYYFAILPRIIGHISFDQIRGLIEKFEEPFLVGTRIPLDSQLDPNHFIEMGGLRNIRSAFPELILNSRLQNLLKSVTASLQILHLAICKQVVLSVIFYGIKIGNGQKILTKDK